MSLVVSFLKAEVGVWQWKDEEEDRREGEWAACLGVGLKDSGSRR